ncbi:hypothetical protein HY621_01805 [Candidatus Uhrbacteria bacterium]|nr:hypothetical protein [Candidatus Uhrbacteria bacterium]
MTGKQERGGIKPLSNEELIKIIDQIAEMEGKLALSKEEQGKLDTLKTTLSDQEMMLSTDKVKHLHDEASKVAISPDSKKIFDETTKFMKQRGVEDLTDKPYKEKSGE